MRSKAANAGSCAAPERQRGQAVIALILCAGVAVSSWLIRRVNPEHIKYAAEARTFHALAQARAALIGYAASDANRPGELPCPDANGDGLVTIKGDYRGSRCKTLLGLLPWRTLRLPEFKDGSGAPLWYALSDRFHAGGSEDINSGVDGDLTVRVRTSAGTPQSAVAILIAPGSPLGGQSRSTTAFGAPDFWRNFCHYLESPLLPTPHCPYSGSPPTDFISGSPGSNDSLLALRSDDLLPVVEKRIVAELRGSANPAPGSGLLGYRKIHGDYPSPVDSAGHPADSGTLQVAETDALNTIALQKEMLKAVNKNDWLGLMRYEIIHSGASGQAEAVRLHVGRVTMTCDARGVCLSNTLRSNPSAHE